MEVAVMLDSILYRQNWWLKVFGAILDDSLFHRHMGILLRFCNLSYKQRKKNYSKLKSSLKIMD
jgi:hypothetical protein